MKFKWSLVALPFIAGCAPIVIAPKVTTVPLIRPVTITWQPAKAYFGDSDKLLYGLTRLEYNKLVGFMNDTNRYIQSYKLDNSHERLEDLGDLMFRYDEGGK